MVTRQKLLQSLAIVTLSFALGNEVFALNGVGSGFAGGGGGSWGDSSFNAPIDVIYPTSGYKGVEVYAGGIADEAVDSFEFATTTCITKAWVYAVDVRANITYSPQTQIQLIESYGTTTIPYDTSIGTSTTFTVADSRFVEVGTDVYPYTEVMFDVQPNCFLAGDVVSFQLRAIDGVTGTFGHGLITNNELTESSAYGYFRTNANDNYFPIVLFGYESNIFSTENTNDIADTFSTLELFKSRVPFVYFYQLVDAFELGCGADYNSNPAGAGYSGFMEPECASESTTSTSLVIPFLAGTSASTTITLMTSSTGRTYFDQTFGVGWFDYYRKAATFVLWLGFLLYLQRRVFAVFGMEDQGM